MDVRSGDFWWALLTAWVVYVNVIMAIGFTLGFFGSFLKRRRPRP